ncbi:5'3'-exonuclease N- and I-domain-containing protein [Heterostelium album PN500]|uniref:5'3'-exonuclease N-and I-domain-containing protein n=1 Tax=Heterostelium pallidum (strain ATCC 26659 / Pp 5 / PN500) TaxID=670386 RepID=D3BJY9_HETP5|nr:5'3'-exonuclease N- and I-domain-containing protein [Heterostelium album PN500]EFA78219.1 5'3'-exonuclease N- and I-domain-containing protein [Heterostelium album PN500]|eukprot:XP_020430345.1 5'3'-exonuclease N- and I-domain-containing protein [Heterostelium album PN500]
MPLNRTIVDFIEKSHLKTSKISLLNDYRIGIDAMHWCLPKLQLKEPFQITMGGAPLTLYNVIQSELDKFKNANINPFFVFSGLSIIKDRNNQSTQAHQRAGRLSTAWEAYYKASYQAAEKQFSAESEKTLLLQFIPSIVAFFRQNNIECFKAPFWAAAQLALFSDPTQKNYLNAVWGGYDLLLFGVYRLIVDIDFEKGVFEWVDLKMVLQDLHLTHDQFVDACLLSGYEFCPIFRTFQNNFNNLVHFRAACDMVRQFQSGIAVIQDHSYLFNTDKYMEAFMKTKCLLRNHMVYYTNCSCEPLYKDLTYQVKPSDLNSIFGPRLPNDLYFYLSQSVVSPQVINNLISGVLFEPYPTADSEEYRRMLEYLKEIRTNTLGLLSCTLNEEISNKSIRNIRWFEPKEEEIQHSKKLSTVFGKQAKPFNLTPEMKQVIQSLSGSTTFQTVVKCFENAVAAAAAATTSSSSTPSTPTTTTTSSSTPTTSTTSASTSPSIVNSDTHSNGTPKENSQTLVLMGYIQDGKLTVFGKLLANIKNSKFLEEIILVIELIRSQCITSDKLNFHPKPTFEGPATNASAALLSRILSILPSTLDNTPWGGPIDHDLMAFHEISRTLYKSIRNLVEISALSNFLTHKIVLEPSEYSSFSNNLPFFVQPNASMGLMAKGMILEDLLIEDMESIFPNCISIEKDLERATDFLNEVMQIVKTLHTESLVQQSLYDNFVEAESIWNRIRKDQIEDLEETRQQQQQQ